MKNIIHTGDNLELMKTIESDTIDLIYCDILYGTGRKFKDYQDLKPNRIEIESHYIPRLKEMYRILKPTGSIYLQMDTKINHWIRCIMDSIFGYNNFKNEIKWVRSRGTNSESRFNEVLDSILFYTKSNDYTFHPQYGSLKESSIKRYNKKDFNGEAYMEQSIQTKKNFKFEGDIRVFNGKEYVNKKGLGWDWTQKELDKRLTEGTIIKESPDGALVYVRYLSESKGSQINSLWNDIETVISVADKYDTQKPKQLIQRIIETSSKEGDLVADFYCGSGTTAKVCRGLNRNFIVCDINPKAIEITKKRLGL